jgi:DNA invertase Pin-like site-specific DNA recombinase
MSNENALGTPYIALLRCSTPGQVETPIEQQRRIVEAYAQLQGLRKVDEIALEGVSGSRPAARSDLDELVRRKLERNDFETVVVQDTSRMTRAGTDEMHYIARTLAAVGIRVAYVEGEIPDNDSGAIILSVRAYVDQQHARAISRNCTRGSVAALEEGRTTHSRRVPYGVDCLYSDSAGKPLYVIRNLADGSQEMRDPQTGAVMRMLPPCEPYRKHKSQLRTYVPGDPAHVEIVRRIFRSHYLNGVGMHTIAHRFNDEGIPSPAGKRWTAETLHGILRNPVYTGRA